MTNSPRISEQHMRDFARFVFRRMSDGEVSKCRTLMLNRIGELGHGRSQKEINYAAGSALALTVRSLVRKYKPELTIDGRSDLAQALSQRISGDDYRRLVFALSDFLIRTYSDEITERYNIAQLF